MVGKLNTLTFLCLKSMILEKKRVSCHENTFYYYDTCLGVQSRCNILSSEWK